MGRCTVKIENNNKIKMCSFFVILGNRKPLLGIPYIKTLGIVTINCDTIESKEADNPEKSKTNMRQEINATEKHYTNTDGSKFEIEDMPAVSDNKNNSMQYFLPGPNSDADKKVGDEITQSLQRECRDVFSGIECFSVTFSLQIKLDSKPNQAPPRCITYALQQPFKEELEHLQQQDIIPPLGIHEIDEWCNSLVLVSKLNGKVRLCLGPARLNQVLIRSVHRGPALNNIFPKLNNVQYFSLVDVSSG